MTDDKEKNQEFTVYDFLPESCQGCCCSDLFDKSSDYNILELDCKLQCPVWNEAMKKARGLP